MSREYSSWVETPSNVPNLLIGFYDSEHDALASTEIFTSNGNDVLIKGPGKYTPVQTITILGKRY